jgi:8-oxo-dGTP pyrophosphatase MutT (NUDIX family)
MALGTFGDVISCARLDAWARDRQMIDASDNAAYRFPVSVKGVVIRDSRVILLKNERDEWELPGGKLELGEDPEMSVRREIFEELGLAIQPARILDSWVYEITPAVQVLVVTYGCDELSREAPQLSLEHKEFCWVDLADVEGLRMPTGYKRSVATWAASKSP